MTPRDCDIKRAQKFYLKIRTMHEDLVYLQSMADQLHLDTTGIRIPLHDINYELKKYHDAARNLERDLDEQQQDHFVKRETHMMISGGGI